MCIRDSFSPTALVGEPRRYWRLVGLLAVIATAANTVVFLVEANHHFYPPDAVAWILMAALIPLLMGMVGRAMFQVTENLWWRATLSVLAVAASGYGTFIVLFVVHCSSGDCL